MYKLLKRGLAKVFNLIKTTVCKLLGIKAVSEEVATSQTTIVDDIIARGPPMTIEQSSKPDGVVQSSDIVAPVQDVFVENTNRINEPLTSDRYMYGRPVQETKSVMFMQPTAIDTGITTARQPSPLDIHRMKQQRTAQTVRTEKPQPMFSREQIIAMAGVEDYHK